MKLSDTKHPMQPIGFDDNGVARFKKNNLVSYLVDRLPGGLNTIAVLDFPREDQEQLAQLIGYSVSGAGELGYFDRDKIAEADEEVQRQIDGREKPRVTADVQREIENTIALLEQMPESTPHRDSPRNIWALWTDGLNILRRIVK